MSHRVQLHGPAVAHGLDPGTLADLIARAEQSRTDALVIARHGEVVAASAPEELERPAPLRSVTKSIVALAFGALLDSGTIASLDEPLTSFFPGLGAHRRGIVLRHVMAQTSGLDHLDHVPADWDAYLHLATSRLASEPGTAYSYSDASTEMLSEVVERAAGIALDEFVDATLFRPLGITDWSWGRRVSGTPHAAFGLEMTATELLRIGLLVGAGGIWEGQQVVSADWLRRLREPSSSANPGYSLLWYLRGQRGLYAHGWPGQQLAVYPEDGLVAVRLVHDAAASGSTPFPELPALLERALDGSG